MRSNILRSLALALPVLAFSMPAIAGYEVWTEAPDQAAAENTPDTDTAQFDIKAQIIGPQPAVSVGLVINDGLTAGPATATYPDDFTLTFPTECTQDGGSATITFADSSSSNGYDFDLSLGTNDNGSFSVDGTFTCTITIHAVDDVIIESLENLKLTIKDIPGSGASLKTPPDQSFTISDNDTAGLFVTDANWTSSAPPGTGTLTSKTTSENGTQASFWVELASQPSGVVNVDVTSDKPAEARISSGGSDVNSLVLSFTPANWDTGQQVTITGQDDAPANPPDGNQPYQITVTTDNAPSQPDSYKNLVGGPVAGINQDNDVPGQFRFTQSSVSGNESDALILQVQRINGSSGPVTVDYAISNGSASSADYNDTTSSSTLSWADGVSGTQAITITLVDDNLWEPASEDFTVSLSNAVGGSLAAPSAETVNINPSDPITISISAPSPDPVLEGNDPLTLVPVSFTVTYSGGTLESPMNIAWATVDGSATGGGAGDVTGVVDYISNSGSINLPVSPGPVSIPAINVTGDTAIEGDENFFVQLSTPLNLVTLAGGGSSMATIMDDDFAADGTFSITNISPNPVDETPTPSTVTVTVSRTGASGSPISDATIRLRTADVTATDGVDYVGQDVILTWDAISGLTSDRTVVITINEDAVNNNESDETFNVNIEDDPGAAPTTQTFGVASGVVTILGDPMVAFNPDGYTVSETGGSVTVFVERVNVDNQPVVVNYTTTDGSATNPQDYTTTTSTLAWGAAELGTKPITIPITADADAIGPEAFTVDLSSCVNCTITDAQTTVNITESAAPPTTPGNLAFSPTGITVSEAVGSAGLFVSRTGGTDGAVSIDWETQPGTAAAPGDFTASSGTLSWSDKEGGSKPIAVPITDDAVQESTESFTVRFVAATETGTKGSPTVSSTPATVTITDNDSPVPGEFSILDANVSEGDGTINVTVTRDVGSTGAVSVTYTTVSGTATGGNPATPATDDYLYTTGVLNWADGDAAAKTIAITIIDDAVVESAEMFTVDLSSPTNGASIADGSANVTIFDNDGGGSFSISDVTVFETKLSATVTVTRSGSNNTAAFVFWQTQDGTAQDENGDFDYQSASGELVWLDGDASTTRTITIPIVNDNKKEPSEFFTVKIVSIQGESALIIKADGIVTINDPIPIPTLSQWAMGLLVLILLGFGMRALPGRKAVFISRR